jgi:hypothetical protein
MDREIPRLTPLSRGARVPRLRDGAVFGQIGFGQGRRNVLVPGLFVNASFSLVQSGLFYLRTCPGLMVVFGGHAFCSFKASDESATIPSSIPATRALQ